MRRHSLLLDGYFPMLSINCQSMSTPKFTHETQLCYGGFPRCALLSIMKYEEIPGTFFELLLTES